jgi:phosphinothricin acetyltransferase
LATADTEPVSIESNIDWFEKHQAHRRPLWVITEANDVAGWVSLNDFYGRPAYNGTAEISIYIKEAFQKKGYAQFGLAHAIQACHALDIHTLLAFVFAHNKPSINFFQKNNFVEMGNLLEIARMDEEKISLLILGLKIN